MKRERQLFTDLVSLLPSVGGSGAEIPVELPFTGSIVGSIPSCTPADVRYAVTRAREVRQDWERVHVRDRAECLLRLHDVVVDRQEELLDLIQLDTGKARRDALEEVLDVLNTIRYYALIGPVLLHPQKRKGAIPGLTTSIERYRPHGVVGFILPWNYPFTLAISDVAPAVLAGNAVVIKPAEQTSLCGLRAALLFLEAGFPDSLVQVVTGRGEDIGSTLIDCVDAIAFTGSTAVGKEIGSRAGERLIPFSLELGGKNPMLILDDAPVETAVEGALRGCFANAGQLCISTERLFVQDEIYEAFVPEFVHRTESLRLGAGFDFGFDVGPLISREQFEKTKAHVDDASRLGASILTGGMPRPDQGPYYFEPTILADVRPGMRVYAEETFGPVVSVYRFRDVMEALQEVNGSRYGLNASIWTGDVRRARRIAEHIACGSVNVNEAYAASWGSVDAPMGGMKESGVGRRHGREGLMRFVESQTIAIQRGSFVGAPFGEEAGNYQTMMMRALHLVRKLRLPI